MKISKKNNYLLLTLVVIILGLFNKEYTQNFQEKNSEEKQIQKNFTKYKVSKVIDGDTIEIASNSKKLRVRLIGIDTPELISKNNKAECFAKEAYIKTKNTLLNKFIYLENDETQEDKDKYDRLLRYVYLEDNTNFNKLLITEGFAHEYTYKAIAYKFQKEFKEAQKDAMFNKKGFWQDNICKKN